MYIENIVEKGRNCSPGAISPLFHNIYNLILDFCVITRTRFFLRDKRLFEITEVEITRADCIVLISEHMEIGKVQGTALNPSVFMVLAMMAYLIRK